MTDDLNQRLACYAQSDCHVEYLAPIVERLLKTIPDVWTPFDPDTLTSDETRVFQSLKATGMLEVRDSMRAKLLIGDFAADITIESHGETGCQIAMNDAYGKLYGLCKAEIDLWEQQGNSGSPFSITQVGCAWRLTSGGCMARESMIGDPQLRHFAIQESLNWGIWRYLDPRPGEGIASVSPVESPHARDPDDPFLGPFRPQVVRLKFNIESQKGWTDFANKYREQGRIKNGQGRNGLATPKVVLIRQSVFTECGATPPS